MVSKNLLNDNTTNSHGRRERLILLGLFFLLFIVVLISLRLGRYGMTFSDIGSALMSSGNPESMASQNSAVLFIIKLPRICLAILVGALP
ncbi:iron ABC transporter permease [endosymbiont 'TC1' of Trimyema compressum]|uniref:iron ABC transporter permease n=1 Tax=endosymbiont 'TC1' of Trimyema compressum TaxID=243899 RepID=UPI001FE1ABF0|nr:iron ABC transporter permease [endosymbiont 'TC1' of Trimyema compressum]